MPSHFRPLRIGTWQSTRVRGKEGAENTERTTIYSSVCSTAFVVRTHHDTCATAMPGQDRYITRGFDGAIWPEALQHAWARAHCPTRPTPYPEGLDDCVWMPRNGSVSTVERSGRVTGGLAFTNTSNGIGADRQTSRRVWAGRNLLQFIRRRISSAAVGAAAGPEEVWTPQIAFSFLRGMAS